MKYHPVGLFTLDKDEYLSDIIEDIFWYLKALEDDN